MTPQPEPLFLNVAPGALGRRYALYHAARRQPARGWVVYVHPFAEEMNKSRRMAALQARALAASGFAVLQIDLLGCGDSGGDFADASWAQWVEDIVHACRWLRQREAVAGSVSAPLWLWGLRAGCLLAAEAAAQLDGPSQFLFWQPTTTGKPLLQQFLRLKVAGELIGGQHKGLMEQLKAELAAGRRLEIAGYTVTPALTGGLERAALRPPVSIAAGRVVWFEVSTQDDAGLSPASQQNTTFWKEAGWHVDTHIVRGPTFWQTSEIEDAPELVAATLAALTGESPGARAPGLPPATTAD